ncbi:MAG: PTS sugar transporter subunit IIC, partial [Clostridia bacterium]|nr:PTS sugar transporter subunit IIC [Clostridia bacterium]
MDNNKDVASSKLTKAKLFSIIRFLSKRWFIEAFTGMAQGLFCTLIAGTILAQIASWISLSGTPAGLAVAKYVNYVASIAKMLMGAGIGVGIANQLKAPKLVMFSAAVAGLSGAFADKIIDANLIASFAPGNPIGSYIVSVISIELG